MVRGIGAEVCVTFIILEECLLWFYQRSFKSNILKGSKLRLLQTLRNLSTRTFSSTFEDNGGVAFDFVDPPPHCCQSVKYSDHKNWHHDPDLDFRHLSNFFCNNRNLEQKQIFCIRMPFIVQSSIKILRLCVFFTSTPPSFYLEKIFFDKLLGPFFQEEVKEAAAAVPSQGHNF